MDNINDCYLYSNFLANKTQSGSITPEQFNLCADVGQLLHLKVKLGLPEEYSVDKREARQEFQTTLNNSDSLRKFIVSKSATLNGAGFDFPTDWVAFANGDYIFVEQINGVNTVTPQPVEFVTIGERGLRLNDYITKPSFEYPICTYLNGQIVVNPTGVDRITLIYVREPVKPKWNYTVNASDQPVYNPTGSVDFEFPKIEWEQICNRIVKYWAVNLREGELYQSVDKAIQTGQ